MTLRADALTREDIGETLLHMFQRDALLEAVKKRPPFSPDKSRHFHFFARSPQSAQSSPHLPRRIQEERSMRRVFTPVCRSE